MRAFAFTVMAIQAVAFLADSWNLCTKKYPRDRQPEELGVVYVVQIIRLGMVAWVIALLWL